MQITISFITKIVFGIGYGYIFMHFYHGDDTWQYHREALVEYGKLLHHPLQFIHDTFSSDYSDNSFEAMYNTRNSYWNHLDDVLFIRLLAVLDVFSFGHYYVNVVLLCFMVYQGNLMLFRLLTGYFPDAPLPLTLVMFYLPVIVFWLSGIRKEGVLFLALATALFYFDRLVRKEGRQIKNFLMFLAGFTALWIIRNMVILCLAPALLAWYAHARLRVAPAMAFAAMFAGATLLFFVSGHIRGMPDLAQKVAERQYDFLQLEAKTRLPLDSLKNTPSSYLQVLPQALNHSFLRPYVMEAKGLLQLASALDVVLFFVAMGLAAVLRIKYWRKVLLHPVVLTLFFTALTGYLIIGYTVPFPGAFVRYKAVFELLFLCIFAVSIRVKRVAA